MVTETKPTTPVGVTHPLDPLTSDEISAASQIAASHEPRDGWRFPLVALDEPAKDVVRSFSGGDSISRRAFLMMLDVNRRARRRSVWLIWSLRPWLAGLLSRDISRFLWQRNLAALRRRFAATTAGWPR